MQLMPDHSKTPIPRQKSRESFNPKSLFMLSTELVANNLIYVETFSTIPEIVGETIFEVARRTGQFENDGCSACLEPFTLAYNGVVLECLAVPSSEQLVRTCSAELQQFLHLTECDLSNCGISDDDGILIHIGTRLHRLEVLLLADNDLSNSGVQKLTAHTRVMSEGLLNLSHLDLSGNWKITDKVCLYLRSFHQLTTLNLSRCRTTEVAEFSLRKHLSLLPCDPSEAANYDTAVMNRGWAAAVIENWKNKFSPRQTIKSNFYSKLERTPSNGSSVCSLIFVKKKKSDGTARIASGDDQGRNVKLGEYCAGQNHFPGTGSKIGPHRGKSVTSTQSNCGHQLFPNGGKGLLSDQNLLRCYSKSREHRDTMESYGLSLYTGKSPIRTGAGDVMRVTEKVHVKQPRGITGKRKVAQRGGTSKRKRVKLVGRGQPWNLNEEGNSLDHDSPVHVDDGEDDELMEEREMANGQRSVFDYLD